MIHKYSRLRRSSKVICWLRKIFISRKRHKKRQYLYGNWIIEFQLKINIWNWWKGYDFFSKLCWNNIFQSLQDINKKWLNITIIWQRFTITIIWQRFKNCRTRETGKYIESLRLVNRIKVTTRNWLFLLIIQ